VKKAKHKILNLQGASIENSDETYFSNGINIQITCFST